MFAKKDKWPQRGVGPFFQHYFRKGKMLRLVKFRSFPCLLFSLLDYCEIGFDKRKRQLPRAYHIFGSVRAGITRLRECVQVRIMVFSSTSRQANCKEKVAK